MSRVLCFICYCEGSCFGIELDVNKYCKSILEILEYKQIVFYGFEKSCIFKINEREINLDRF